MREGRKRFSVAVVSASMATLLLGFMLAVPARADLKEVRERGVLRHLGVVYANFVTGSGDGLDVEMMQMFARHLGVRYEFVETTWAGTVGDLTGKKVIAKGDDVEIGGEVPVRGDVIATGFTILSWRKKIVEFSTPSFPTQIWVIAGIKSTLNPIKPSGSEEKDIAAVLALLEGRSVLGVPDTCLDPNLYKVKEAGASTVAFTMNVNALVPAVMNGEAEATLLEVPDALTALQKWPGQIKVLGPLSPMQNMACAFDKSSVELTSEFNRFFATIFADGTYEKLVRKYYPLVFDYYPEFFKRGEQ